MRFKKILFLPAFALLLSPALAFGATTFVDVNSQLKSNKPQTVNDIFGSFAEGNAGNFFPVLVLVGLVTFLAGVLRFVRAGDNEEQRTAGRQVMIYGIIILFVMMGYWGFVRILTQSFFGSDPSLPNYLPPLMGAK